MRYGFVISVAGSKWNTLIWPFVPWVTTTPLLKSAATMRPLAKILDTLFNNRVSSISVTVWPPAAMRDLTSACSAGVSIWSSVCSNGVGLVAMALPDATIVAANTKAAIYLSASDTITRPFFWIRAQYHFSRKTYQSKVF